MRDAEITADMAWEKGCPVRLLVNRIRPDLMRKGLAPDVDDIIDASAVQLLGIVPEDRRVLISSGSSRLLCDMRRSLCLRAIENISARLDGENRELLEFNKTKA